MTEQRKPNLINGAMILVAATVLVKIIGAIYKIPLTGIIGTEGRGYFASAYNIYSPIYAISMAGLPIAVSKIVSKNVALGRYRDVKQVVKVTTPVFMLLGITGTIVLLLLSYPYTSGDWLFSIHSPKTIFAIISVAPSIFFCCLSSCFRGYFAGLGNMFPTAITDVLEASGKLIFGLSLSKWVVSSRLAEFAASSTVFGEAASSQAEALSLIYPWAAAAAVAGVTAGTCMAMLFSVLRYKIGGDKITREMLVNSPKAEPRKNTLKELLSVAVPAAMSALVLNITNLIDTWTVQNRLDYVVTNNLELIKQMYGKYLTAGNVLDENIATYLYGTLDATLDFRNLAPTLLMTFGVSAIPVISSAWAKKDTVTVKNTVNAVTKIISLVSLPAGFGLMVLSEPILRMMYNGTNAASSITMSAQLLSMYGAMMLLLSIATPFTNMLQALGRADIPAKIMVVACAVKIVCNYIFVSVPSLNVYGSMIGTLLFYLLCSGVGFVMVERTAKIRPDYSGALIKPAIAAAGCGASAWGAYKLFSQFITFGDPSSRLNGSTVSCILAIGVAVVVYAFLVIVLKIFKKEDVFMLPKGEKIAKTLEKYKLLG